MEFIFGISGFIGGILCAIGDVLFDFKGKSDKLGAHKFIESKWEVMSDWRFKVSILFASIGVPLYFLGFTSLAMQITDKTFAMVFWITSLIGTTGGLFIHGILCCFPIIYKKIKIKYGFDAAENLLNSIYDTIKIPFYSLYLFLVIFPSLFIGYALLQNYLLLPAWLICFTPLCMMIIGMLLRLIKKSWFNDFPGIVMPSLGLAMIGMMGVINYIM